MKYVVNGRGEVLDQVRFDQHEIFASVPAGTLEAEEDTVFAFSTEEEFLEWLRRSDPKTADQISQLMTALTQLSIAHREKGAEINQAIQALIGDQESQNAQTSAGSRKAGEKQDIDPAFLTTGLVLYEHINFRGRDFNVKELIPYPNLNALPWWNFNDKTSSFRLKSPVGAVFEHSWFKGRSWWVFPGPRDVPWVGEWWNDRISSCVCGPSYETILKLILKSLL